METGVVCVSYFRFSPFKSYYVVWKLLRHPFPRSHRERFKSYYVVWKLYRAFSEKMKHFSLNRTM